MKWALIAYYAEDFHRDGMDSIFDFRVRGTCGRISGISLIREQMTRAMLCPEKPIQALQDSF